MTRATYAELGDACATAHAMELIGHRWTYPILRELMLGPKRFNALLASVRGITPAVLTSRLRELGDTGLVEPVSESPGTLFSYALTPWALELAPVLRALGRWAQSSPTKSRAGGLTPDAAVQAMVTMADGLTPQHDVHVRLVLFDARAGSPTDVEYCVRCEADRLSAVRTACNDAPSTIRCDSSTWGDILFNGREPERDAMAVTGDRGAARRLVDCFRRATPPERSRA